MSFKDRWHEDKRRKAAQKAERAARKSGKVGVAWWTPQEWEKLVAVAADREGLHDTYEEWKQSAETVIEEMKNAGAIAEPVMLKVEELEAWCKEEGRPNNGAARAQYTSKVLRERAR